MPSRPRVIFNDGERSIEAEEGMPLLFAAMAQGIFIPSACGGQASCGQCRVRVVSGAREHVPEERGVLNGEEMARGVHLACQLRVSGETRVMVPRGYLEARQYHTRVAEIRDLTPAMREVVLDLQEPATMEFLAGQYVQFLRPGTEGDSRPVYRAYSMASAPSRSSRLTLLFARVPGGACTTYVFERLQVGERVTINGPFGSFHLRRTDRRIILIAGGSGIAPMRAILADMVEKRIDREVTFLYSAHGAADLVYLQDMQDAGHHLRAFRFVPVLSRPSPADRWNGETGGLPAALARILPELDDHEAYLCGGPGLIDASINALKAKGLRDELILFDKFS